MKRKYEIPVNQPEQTPRSKQGGLTKHAVLLIRRIDPKLKQRLAWQPHFRTQRECRIWREPHHAPKIQSFAVRQIFRMTAAAARPGPPTARSSQPRILQSQSAPYHPFRPPRRHTARKAAHDGASTATSRVSRKTVPPAQSGSPGMVPAIDQLVSIRSSLTSLRAARIAWRTSSNLCGTRRVIRPSRQTTGF